MTGAENALYLGAVTHKRLRPRTHKFSYNVFATLLDCDKLEETGKCLRLFSHNSFNLFSLYDRDHGDGSQLPQYLRDVALGSGVGDDILKFYILSYPRILGYAFNPLTTYYCMNKSGDVVLMIYEVNNTFGERQTYVLPVEQHKDGLVAQSCSKRLYVSPFNTDKGTYSFRVTSPASSLTVGIALRDETGPLMRANFHAQRSELSDKNLLGALARTGWMTVRVVIGIHWQAAKLWLKGISLMPRPAHGSHEIAYIDGSTPDGSSGNEPEADKKLSQ